MKFRAFIAVDIGKLPSLVELEEKLRATNADLNLVEPENIHITLKFLGDTDEELIGRIEEIMRNSVRGVGPMELTLEGLGAFPSMNYMRVIWIGIKGADALSQIAQRLDEQLGTLGFKSDKKGYTPHLTIARVRSKRNKSELKAAVENHSSDLFGTVPVDRIVLKKSVLSSSGPTYYDVREVALENAVD